MESKTSLFHNLNQCKRNASKKRLILICLASSVILQACENDKLSVSVGVPSICSKISSENPFNFAWKAQVIDTLDRMLLTDGEEAVKKEFESRKDCKKDVKVLLSGFPSFCSGILSNYCLLSVGVPSRPNEAEKVYARPLRTGKTGEEMISRIFD